MRLKGSDPLEPFRRLYTNVRAMDAGHAPPHTILMGATGGGFCTRRIAHKFIVLHEEGLTKGITHFVTSSGSGGPAGGLLSGIPRYVPSMYDCLAVTKLVKGWRFFRRFNQSLFRRSLNGAMSPLAFDQSRINSSRQTWDVAALRVRDAQVVLLDAKGEGQRAVECVVASSAISGMCPRVMIDGELYCDSGLLPIRLALEKYPDVDTVILCQSRTHPKHFCWIERNYWPQLSGAFLIKAGIKRAIRRIIGNIDRQFIQDAEYLAALKDRACVRVAPTPEDDEIMPDTMDIFRLRRDGSAIEKFIRDRLREAKPVIWV